MAFANQGWIVFAIMPARVAGVALVFIPMALAGRLRMSEESLACAREELIREDLVAYRTPLTQVLSLPQTTRAQRGGLASLGEMFRALAHPTGSTGRQP